MAGGKNNEVWIATSADEAYLEGAAVALRSAVEKTSSPNIHVRVLDSGLSLESAGRLMTAIGRWPGVTSAELLSPSMESIADLPITAHFSLASYARLQAQDLVDTETLVYIDSDTLVLGDVSELAGTDFGDCSAAAVIDSHCPTLASGLPYCEEELGASAGSPYFNCGVIVMRPRAWKEDNVAERVTGFSRRHGDAVRFAEQDGINATLADRILPLDPRWNVQVGAVLAVREPANRPSASRQPEPREAAILHFVGRKPWQAGLEPYTDLAALNLQWVACLSRSGIYSRTEMLGWLTRWAGGQLSHFARGALSRIAAKFGRTSG